MSTPSNMVWSLSATGVILVVLALQPPVTSLKHKNMICDKLEECACGFPTGEGVNLTNLALKPLMLNDTASNLIFYFNPCTDVSGPCPNGSLFCMVDEKSNLTINLGSKGVATFSSQGIYGPVFINYEAGGIETEIQLDCWQKNETNLMYNENYDKTEPELEVKYHLLLQSKETCLRPVDYLGRDVVSEGLSTGSTLFIALLVVCMAYILVGAAANHFLRGATGWEMIPHVEFWRRLPTLLMDGVKFVANGCRPPPSYEQI